MPAADPSRTVRVAVAARPGAPHAAVRTLATDPAWQVREAISQNAGVTPEILIGSEAGAEQFDSGAGQVAECGRAAGGGHAEGFRWAADQGALAR
ncbi:hypothetical protein [Actinoplanes derwentensis]|uniref:Leucine rich repeat variant n=1 Tax=Actinoplanes derwentensis TaxID=113562 RepID=A0A1H2A061_9ACTN|nr:hypothetical protein [Actinoplanes derwentensis]GID83460.1 hypothetical protein Ade03nite_23840 [Actinoplanes derwentensis]SDT39052.1 Leucine rich repeat variant [Actinoplanes derwentensis]